MGAGLGMRQGPASRGSSGRSAEDMALCRLGVIVAWNLHLLFPPRHFPGATDGRVAFAGCPFPERGQAWAPFPAPSWEGAGPEGGWWGCMVSPRPPRAGSSQLQLPAPRLLPPDSPPRRRREGEAQDLRAAGGKCPPVWGGRRGLGGRLGPFRASGSVREAVRTIAVVGNPHWISIRTMGIFKREKSIYIYKKLYTHFIVQCPYLFFLFDTVNLYRAELTGSAGGGGVPPPAWPSPVGRPPPSAAPRAAPSQDQAWEARVPLPPLRRWCLTVTVSIYGFYLETEPRPPAPGQQGPAASSTTVSTPPATQQFHFNIYFCAAFIMI